MNALEIKNLSKDFGKFMLDNLTLSLPKGSIMGLVGENGAGKSTTIKLILNILKKDSGTITVLGKDNQDNFQHTKEDIGVVLDEVGFPDCFKAKQVNKLMSLTYKNWDEKVFYDYLKRLSLPLDKDIKSFSTGMKMKLNISVALSHNPKILILDEPTSGLDPVIRDEILDIFNEFTRNEENSILISSHIVSDLEKICDYIAFLKNGKLVLMEEKDLLLEKYCIIHCSKEELQKIDSSYIKGKKETRYGMEVIIDRNKVPNNLQISPITIEELFIFMIKEEK